jgi:hypothetical protein
MDELAERVLADYLRLTDELAPGVVEGVYLVGSLALDDFHAGVSDIDFVGVLAGDPEPDQVAALAAVHARVAAAWPRPYLDGPYLTRADLAAGPDACGPRPAVHEHAFTAASRFAQDQITWHTLARHGVTVTGPAPAALGVRTGRSALVAWVRGNVASYWRPWTRRYASPLGLLALGDDLPVWGVLGMARMSYTIATGEITSKRGAGEYALRKAVGSERVLAECLRIRRGGGGASLYRSRLARRRGAVAYLRTTIDGLLRPA